LWAIHELHHADGEMNVTTSHRTWWLELPVQTIVIAVPLLLAFGLGGPEVGTAIFVASRFSLYFTHCNFKLRLGPLTPLFCGPQVHRIHHSRLPEHQDRNFAQTFPFLDILFGTYHPPEHDEFPPTGAPGLDSNAPIWKAQLQPFLIWTEKFRHRSHEDPAL
jgi:sterol desaturase/sphingolipid hydroxylase (fatty acid hydroxylase superfamily)